MAKKASDYYYAVRIGRRPGIYKGWTGEFGANMQISGISNYDYNTGYLKTQHYTEADEYLRANEIYVVTSSFAERNLVQYNEEMSKVYGQEEKSQASADLPEKKEQQIVYPAMSTVPYEYDIQLESFLQKYYPEKAFTDEQKAAIQAINGAHLLYAIPGSGKTAVLTARAGYMIHLGKAAQNMLIMTFGKKAAEHMGNVFHERFPDFARPCFCTIHSFCNQILKEAAERHQIEKYKLICDEEDDPIPDAMDPEASESWIIDESADETPSASTVHEDQSGGNRYAGKRNPIYILERTITELGYCEKASEARPIAEQAATVISCIKNRMLTENEIQNLPPMEIGANKPVKIWDIYAAYQDDLRHQNPPEMDFDDMLTLAAQVLEHKDQLSFWQDKYHDISIDEVQDTSPLQHSIIHTLYNQSVGSMFMVGDDDQSIYAFRGATPQTMLQFDQIYPDAHIHRMGVNFRSDSLIVKMGDMLIRRNKENRAPKDMTPNSHSLGDIRIIDISSAAQGRFLLEQAKKFSKINENSTDQEPDTLAILYRNNTSALLPLAYFFKYDIPFASNKVFDIISLLYSRTAINIMSVLRFAMNPSDVSSYTNAYYVWNCYQGLYLNKEKAVNDLLATIDDHGKRNPVLPQLKAMLLSEGDKKRAKLIEEIWQKLQMIQKQNNPAKAIIMILEDLQYNKNPSIKQKNVQLLIAALISIASMYEDIPSFLDAMIQLRAKKKWDSHNAQKKPCITLSTMHSAKGQEYDHVIIIDAQESIMPGDPQKPLPFWHDTWQNHVEEERRLFYVAVTRAKHDLQIIVNGLHHTGQNDPTRFIFEILKDAPKIPIVNMSAYANEIISEDEINKALGIPYYAVRNSNNPGVFTDYNLTGIQGFSNPVYKKFDTKTEAYRYLHKSVSCSVMSLYSSYPLNLPPPVETSLLGLFHVKQISELSAETIHEIREKTAWMFSKDSLEATAVDYSQCTREYALQYLPVNFYKPWIPLFELLQDNRLPIRDEVIYNDGTHPIRILEIGVGPGTATLSTLSFYAKIAEENPGLTLEVEYTAIEYEIAFKPVFDKLVTAMMACLPENLHVNMKPLQIRDAFAFLKNNPDSNYDMVLESNMLNHNEHVDVQNLKGFIQDIHRALVWFGKAIFIEPADEETSAFLKTAVKHASEANGFLVTEPKTAFIDVSGISLYCSAVGRLRNKLEDDKHWFSYTVLTKNRGCDFT